MNKITFKLSTKSEGCRIEIDMEERSIVVEDVDDAMIDSVIKLLGHYDAISIVNSENSKPKEKPTVIGPQTKDDLIISKVEFKHECVEDVMNILIRTAYWAMYKMKVPEGDIRKFIFTCIDEMSMRYNKEECIKYSVGDIVDCNYGMHLRGEINGNHVHGIVCDITNSGMAYLVPIAKVKENLTSLSYITFDAPQDAVYDKKRYNGGTALLDKGRYLRAERFHSVIGKTTPEFFAKVLDKLSTTFDFRGNLVINDDTRNDGVEVIETETAITSGTAEAKKPVKNISKGEAVLLEMIGNSLQKLDCTKKAEEQIESFLTEIGMTTTDRMVTQAFVIACNIKKISYENVILELYSIFPKVKDNNIKSVLNKNFKEWLKQYPEIVEKCPWISFMALLKVFAKRFS